jgi:hypothetical protein
MVAYSFQRQFEAPILAGIKRQTIRAHRKRHAEPTERMQLYVGLRTKHCRMIGTGTCVDAKPITIDLAENRIRIGHDFLTEPGDRIIQRPGMLDAFARSDGFEHWAAMRDFWTKNHPGRALWSGVLLRWEDFLPFRRLA